MDLPRVRTHITKATRKRSQKLSTLSCLDEVDGFGSGLVTGSGQLSSFCLNHELSSSIAFGDSATFKMALETSLHQRPKVIQLEKPTKNVNYIYSHHIM